tara:strand:- start:247 stop:384 length:138 start_codon:yes stop_codon:yes gene_type:complete
MYETAPVFSLSAALKTFFLSVTLESSDRRYVLSCSSLVYAAKSSL